MNQNDSENSIEEIEFSKKSDSISEDMPNPRIQNEISQSENNFLLMQNKFSESSEKSALLSVEKNAFLKMKAKKNLLNIDKSKNLQNLNEINDYGNNLQDFLTNIKKTVFNEREISNKSEEIINLNSRLNQMYNENQYLEDRFNSNEKKFKILSDEYNKTSTKIVECEFLNRQLSDEIHVLKTKIHDYSYELNQKQNVIEQLKMENQNLSLRSENLKKENSKLVEEINERNKEAIEFFSFKKKIEILKEKIYDDIHSLEEEKFNDFLAENDFIKLLRIFIKERIDFKNQLKEKNLMTETINKLNKSLETQNNENRFVIEQLSSQKQINEKLCKNLFRNNLNVF